MTTTVQPSQSIVLEQNKRFSECLLWRMEREYFEKKGIDAWLHDVPFYITSNPTIARAYANITMHFIRDWIVKHPEARQHPFYIIELGTGPGRFSYYTVKMLDQLRHEYNMQDVSIVYVMSDFAKANLDYHQTHPALKPYFEKGILDLAVLDMENPAAIQLINSKVELNQKTLVNPLTVFANYLFDTIKCDSFAVQQGKIYELLVTLATDESNLMANQPISLEKISVSHHTEEIHLPYYNDTNLDRILELYRTSLADTNFLFPSGSIRGLEYLRHLANGRMMILSSDKAYSDLAALENLGPPSLSFHGNCFSLMANCHAIGEYCKNNDGEFYAPPTRRGLKTCFYTTGIKLSDLPETFVALKRDIEKFNPADAFNVYRHMCETIPTLELETITSYLQLFDWDPQPYSRLSNRIVELAPEAELDTVNFIANNLHRVAENYYYMPSTDCILFEIGVFFHALKRYAQAVFYYLESEKYLGDQFGLKYNIALCFHHLGKNHESVKYFIGAQRLDPQSKETKDWIDHLQKNMLEDKYEPRNL